MDFRYIGCVLLLALLWLLPRTDVAAEALSPVQVSYTVSAKDIDPHIEYFNDRKRAADIQSIDAFADAFIPLKEKGLILNSGVHWYRMRLDMTSAEEGVRWFMSVGVSTATRLDVYWRPDSGNIRILSTDSIEYFPSGRKFHYPVHVVPLDIEPESQGTLWIAYAGVANFPLKARIYSEHDMFGSGLQFSLLNGIYLGAISVFFLIFMGQFLMRPSRIIGYYTLFVLSVITFMMQIGGYKSHFGLPAIWPYHNEVAGLIGGSIYIWYFLFTDCLFRLRENNRFLHRMLTGFSWAVLIITAIGFYTDLDWLLGLLIALGLPWPLIAAIWFARLKHPSARFFIVGSLLHCVAAYLLILASLGMDVIYNKYLFAVASLGQLVDIACFSLAILFQNERLRSSFHSHVNQQVTDLHHLAQSERLSSQAMTLSRNTLLKTAATAHDLQQPLASIRLLLTMQDTADPTIHQVNKALDYATTLLHSVLSSSAEDYQEILKRTDMQGLLDEIAQRHRLRFESKGLKLITRCAPHEMVCMPLVVNRLLDNLLSNALKYTHSGGVLVSGRRRNQDQYLIQVWDCGVGMSHRQIRQILAPFKRDVAEEVGTFGYGLGLFIVKSLCEQAGYELDIKSREGRGSCVSILITSESQTHLFNQ